MTALVSEPTSGPEILFYRNPHYLGKKPDPGGPSNPGSMHSPNMAFLFKYGLEPFRDLTQAVVDINRYIFYD